MKNSILLLCLLLITFQIQAQQPDFQAPSISSRWQVLKNNLSTSNKKSSSFHFRESVRLDSVYCYHYNIGSENYQIDSRSFYTYTDSEADLISEYREQQFLHDGFGTWRDVWRSLHEYDEEGQQTSVVVQSYDETTGTLKNDYKIDFSYLNAEKISEEIFSEWDEAVANWSFRQRTMYAYENGVLREKLTQDYEANTSTWLDAIRQTFDHDEQQRLVMQTSEIWVEGLWRNSDKQIYSEWMGAFYTQEIQQVWNQNNNLWENEHQIRLTYEADLLTKSIHQFWDLNTQLWENKLEKNYEYNAQGELLRIFDKHWQIADYQYKPLSRTLTSYDLNEQLAEEVSQDWQVDSSDWRNTHRTRRIYNAQGHETERYTETWDLNTDNWKISNRLIYSYDSLNFLVQSIKQQLFGQQFVDILKTEYERDTLGNVRLEKMFFSQVDWVLFAQNSFAYDEFGQLGHQISYYVDFPTNALTPNTKSVFFYFENGQIKEQIDQSWRASTATWQDNVRQIYSYEAHGKLKRVWQQGWNNFTEDWTNGRQTTYGYDENVHLVEIIQENWQLGAWRLLEKTTYFNDLQGQALTAEQQTFQNGDHLVFKLIFDYDENDAPTLLERHQRRSPIYDWVNAQQCDYFYSVPTSTEKIEFTNLSCLFPNPYVAGTRIFCDDLELNKTYEVRIFNLQGQSLYQTTFSGREFIIDKKWTTGLYLIGVFYQKKVLYMERIFIK